MAGSFMAPWFNFRLKFSLFLKSSNRDLTITGLMRELAVGASKVAVLGNPTSVQIFTYPSHILTASSLEPS